MQWTIYKNRGDWMARKPLAYADGFSAAQAKAAELDATHITGRRTWAQGPDGIWRTV
jgi:hypothetical protein